MTGDKTIWPASHTCHQCGKAIYNCSPEDCAYKMTIKRSSAHYGKVFFCSWKCLRACEKEIDEKYPLRTRRKRKVEPMVNIDCICEGYTGDKRFAVSHPAHKFELFVAAPDEISALKTAADNWKERWSSLDFYPYAKVRRL